MNQTIASKPKRTLSIDILRALTMLFMVFVNDLPSIKNVPEWLLHTEAQTDGMGFSDIIFPLFLFIVGLSIPLALNYRRSKGDGAPATVWHIVERTAALVIMGVFMVNIGDVNAELMPFGQHTWQLLMGIGIMLFWMHYRPIGWNRTIKWGLKALGAALLIYLALIYTGGDADNPIGMTTSWWGILGLIGWAYLLNAVFYMLVGPRWKLLLLGCIVLLCMNMQEFGMIEGIPKFRLVVSASMHLLVMLGVLCTSVLLHLQKQQKDNYFLPIAVISGLLMIAFGFMIRPFWIISKILATPTWTMICAGAGFVLMGVLYWVADLKGHYKWAQIIKPAGTSTLTCYLLPYVIYPLILFSGLQWPELINSGLPGIIRSFVFALAIVLLTGVLERYNLKLKV
jgi:heparan-alpha-glucosaminide N-acetyltransferase